MKKTTKLAAGRFLSQHTFETRKAIDALRQIFDKRGAGDAEATFATALSERFLKDWKHSQKLTQSSIDANLYDCFPARGTHAREGTERQ